MYLLLADENFPFPSVRRLRQAGFDIEAVSKTAPGISDVKVLEWADREQRVVLTLDSDFAFLAMGKRTKLLQFPGVVYFRDRPRTPTEPGELLIDWFATPRQARFYCTYENQRFIMTSL